MAYFIEMVKDKLTTYWHVTLIVTIGLLLGIFTMIIRQPSDNEQTVEAVIGQVDSTNETDEVLIEQPPQVSEPEWIMVDIKGNVVRPGVYEVLNESRVQDVVELAGGFTEEANTLTVNLAEKVQDQMVVYVGGEEDPLAVAQPSSETSSESQKININLASKDELMQLNSIGSVKADNIIKYREEHGPFNSIEEITNVSGIGDKTFDSLKENLTI
ncbi:MAG TPA: helix-hairpin-helix domain-containing protein [Alloiococcus sp.]|nr:helix-hairpin-helix domain-containing protein [Alloiococcus sp.]